jgi:hypothetical protein
LIFSLAEDGEITGFAFEEGEVPSPLPPAFAPPAPAAGWPPEEPIPPAPPVDWTPMMMAMLMLAMVGMISGLTHR